MLTDRFCCPCKPVFGLIESIVGSCGGLTVIVTLELLLRCESPPVRLRTYVPGRPKVAEVTTGFTCPETSGKVAVGVPNDTGPGPLVSLHVVLNVAPMGNPSSFTLPFNTLVTGLGNTPRLPLSMLF